MNPSAPDLLKACVAESLVQARGWIPRWLDELQTGLAQRENAARSGHERHSLGQARQALTSHRALFGQRFLDALQRSLQQGEPAKPLVRRPEALDLDDLTLVDDGQMQRSVSLSRLQQSVKLGVAAELAAFSARLNRLQGLDTMRVDRNPLRPEAVVLALTAALDTVHLADGLRAHWLEAGALPLGQHLNAVYQRLDHWLAQQGIEPVGYRVIPSPAPHHAHAGFSSTHRSADEPATALVGKDALLSLDHLHDLLAGSLARSGATVSDQGASGSGNAMVRTLAGELVSQLLRRAVDDARLLPTVRDLVQQFKTPLQQLARLTPRFFADRQNPARLLVERITARGLAFATEQDAGFEAFAGELLSAVRSLQAPVHRLPELLANALKRFPAAMAPSTAARRDLLAEQLATEFQAHEHFARAPGVVRRFVTGPWAQVVAHARLSQVGSDAALDASAPVMRYLDVLTDLLWSSQLMLASRDRPRLIKAVPVVLRTLREGLDTIDHPRPQAETFFNALLGLQDAAYRTLHSVTLVSQAVWADAGPINKKPALSEPIRVRERVRKIEPIAVSSAPDFSDTETLSSDWLALSDREAPPVAEGLSVGSWIDLSDGERTQRYQLYWASPHGRLFQFAAPHGRSISLSRTGLRRLQSNGQLQVVSQTAQHH